MSNRYKILISVVMTSYNYESFLPDAIESILHQTYSNLEFLIIDSGSTDSSPDIIKKYLKKDSRIKACFFKNFSNSEAFNYAVDICKGKYVARADSDDISLPQRLESQIGYMQAADLDVCGSWYQNFGMKNGGAWCPVQHKAICAEMLFRSVIINGTLMIKTELVKNEKYDTSVFFDDYEWPIRISSRAKLGNVPSILIKRRCHAGQASKQKTALIRKELQKYRFRHFYNMFPNTPIQQYLALSKVSDLLSFSTIDEMKDAGSWLLKLSDCEDYMLRKKMKNRWINTCKRSELPGDESEAIRLAIENKFDQLT